MMDKISSFLFLLDRLDMIKGYGKSRTGAPYRGFEDVLWDIASDRCAVGHVLTKILENRDVN